MFNLMRSIALLGISAALIAHANNYAPQSCDLMELNHYHDHEGRQVFDQLIFWEWCETEDVYRVMAWRLVNDKDDAPVTCNHTSKLWSTSWRDGSIRREMVSTLFKESWTQIDPERADKAKHPEQYRTGFIKPINVEGVEQ